MDSKENISITEPTAASTLDDLFGFEAARKRQEARDLITENMKLQFKPWRVFINHIDSYHGKILTDVLSDTMYIDSLSVLPDEEDEEFEDEYIKEEEKEEEKEKENWSNKTARISRKYEVIGTVLDSKYTCPENVTVISSLDEDLFLSELMTCGTIIYDITQEPGQIKEICWVLKEIIRELESKEKKSPKTFKRDEPIRHIILISTIMTWALTKPLDPADPDLPFTEADYRKRKPHPNYKEHIRCEREIVTVKKITNLKDQLKTLVICCGITYGEEEGPLHYLFKMAWQNAPFLPIFSKGRNKIPLLHVRDLTALILYQDMHTDINAGHLERVGILIVRLTRDPLTVTGNSIFRIVVSVLQNWPPMRYIVAVEQELISQNTIVKKISQGLTTGKIKNISKEEALLLPEVSQQVYDQMTVDLNIDPVYIIDRIRWHLDMPFQNVIDIIIKEYKAARNLRPVKIIVLGPPASGKTRVARYLAKHYEIHYIHVKTLISDTIQKLIDDINAAKSSMKRQDDDLKDMVEDAGEDNKRNQEEEAEEQEEKEVIVAKLQEQLDEIRTNMATNNGRLDDVVLNKLFLNRLKSKDCLNQGYVMDGYPKTIEQARQLFLIDKENLEEEEEEEQFEDENIEIRNTNVAILPELVVVLEASDEFLKERIMNLPEKEIQNTHYTEEHMLRRLREYRERNTDDNTPLQLFDELEIHPLVISVEADTCPDMFPTIYQCLEKLGEPRNYGLTAEEIEAARKRAEAETRAAEVAEKLRKEREILERKKQREEKMKEWTNLLEKLKQEEEERLCILAEPLRQYLTKYVFPTLTEALIEVAKLRPEDPIDFLAEYLFKKNPEGKMFQPDYTETMSMLLDVIGQQQNDVLPGEGLKADVEQFLKRQDELSTAETEKSEVQDEVENSEVQDMGDEIKTISISEQTSEYEGIDDLENDELNFVERIIDEFEGEV